MKGKIILGKMVNSCVRRLEGEQKAVRSFRGRERLSNNKNKENRGRKKSRKAPFLCRTFAFDVRARNLHIYELGKLKNCYCLFEAQILERRNGA